MLLTVVVLPPLRRERAWNTKVSSCPLPATEWVSLKPPTLSGCGREGQETTGQTRYSCATVRVEQMYKLADLSDLRGQAIKISLVN